MKILLVEDEPKMVQSLKKGLEGHQIEVDSANNGREGARLAELNDYAVIISDVMMPEMDGLEMLRQIRGKSNQTPVILLTALGQTDEKVEGFDAGADDYLTKPFEFRELLVRVRALARRPKTSYQIHAPSSLKFADLEMDLDKKVLYRSGQHIALTPREFSLMEYLMRHPGKVISKAEISEQVWNLTFDTGTNFVEVYFNFLRKKVDKGFPKKLIHTQFRTGYVLREDSDESRTDA
ncbi:MAG TPA: response regulator transcription factor [Saprospiraceae bacterium]|nr:response regulator transcription factor [Saprospiraceae bacterium]